MSRIGAALRVSQFEQLGEWLHDERRPLELQDFIDFDVLMENGRDVVSRYDKLLAKSSVTVGMHGPFKGIDLANPDPEMCAIVQSRICSAMRFGIELGIDQIVIHSPFSYWHTLNSRNYTNMWPQLFAAVENNLGPILKLASDAGVCVVLENVEDAEPWIRQELIKRIGSHSLAASLDTGHGQIACSKFNGPPVLDQIDILESELKHVHLHDNDGHADRHWNVGDGIISWAPIFEKLRAFRSRPRLILELVDHLEEIPKMVRQVQEVFGEDL